MRTMMNRIRRNIFVLMLALGIPFVARAQHFPDELNFKLDWQVNAPVGYDYADKLSGWGMNFEVAYEVSERWSLGAFASIHTNHGYAGRETIQLSPTEAHAVRHRLPCYEVLVLVGEATPVHQQHDDHLQTAAGSRRSSVKSHKLIHFVIAPPN